jgi:hypothetical protein
MEAPPLEAGTAATVSDVIGNHEDHEDSGNTFPNIFVTFVSFAVWIASPS